MTDLAIRTASILTWFNLPLWQIVIKSTLIIALAALTCQLLRRHSAALRHRVWVIGLAAALLVQFASLLLPRFLVPVLPPNAPTVAATQDLQQIPINDTNMSLPSARPGSSANSVAPHSTAGKDLPVVAANTATGAPQPEAHQHGVVARPGIERLLVFTWLLVSALSAMLFVVLLVVQQIRLARLGKIEDADWVAAVVSAAKDIVLKRPGQRSNRKTEQSLIATINCAIGSTSCPL